MSSTKIFVLLLSSATLALSLSACGISKLGGGGGTAGGGSGGSGACDTPDPSEASCDSNADCEFGSFCNMDGCAPSGCECDGGGWSCTEDCRPACVPNPACGNLEQAACADDTDCEEGFFCNPDQCAVTACDCAHEADCPAICEPSCSPIPTCEGPDPSEGSCHEDVDCEDGRICNLDACQSSYCVCHEGGWACSDDCVGACVLP